MFNSNRLNREVMFNCLTDFESALSNEFDFSRRSRLLNQRASLHKRSTTDRWAAVVFFAVVVYMIIFGFRMHKVAYRNEPTFAFNEYGDECGVDLPNAPYVFWPVHPDTYKIDPRKPICVARCYNMDDVLRGVRVRYGDAATKSPLEVVGDDIDVSSPVYSTHIFSGVYCFPDNTEQTVQLIKSSNLPNIKLSFLRSVKSLEAARIWIYLSLVVSIGGGFWYICLVKAVAGGVVWFCLTVCPLLIIVYGLFVLVCGSVGVTDILTYELDSSLLTFSMLIGSFMFIVVGAMLFTCVMFLRESIHATLEVVEAAITCIFKIPKLAIQPLIFAVCSAVIIYLSSLIAFDILAFDYSNIQTPTQSNITLSASLGGNVITTKSQTFAVTESFASVQLISPKRLNEVEGVLAEYLLHPNVKLHTATMNTTSTLLTTDNTTLSAATIITTTSTVLPTTATTTVFTTTVDNMNHTIKSTVLSDGPHGVIDIPPRLRDYKVKWSLGRSYRQIILRCVLWYFATMWLLEITSAVLEFVTAYVVALWYFTLPDVRGTRVIPANSISLGLWIALRYHIGTLALGSLLRASFKWLRPFCLFAANRCANTQYSPSALSQCIKCIVLCLEGLIRTINQMTFIECVLSTKSYFRCCNAALSRVNSQMPYLAGLYSTIRVMGYCTTAGFSLSISILVCIACSNVYPFNSPSSKWYVESPLAVSATVAVVSALIIRICVATVEQVAECLIYCYLVEASDGVDVVHAPSSICSIIEERKAEFAITQMMSAGVDETAFVDLQEHQIDMSSNLNEADTNRTTQLFDHYRKTTSTHSETLLGRWALTDETEMTSMIEEYESDSYMHPSDNQFPFM